MTRMTEKHYQRRLALAMFAYIGAMLLVWPLARQASDVWLKSALALLPLLPMLYAIGLMAQRVWQSDELEQRMHLVALGVATVLVATFSLIGGFLAAAGVLAIGGDILIWVFPLMMFSYGLARWWVVTRRYGGDMSCDNAGASILWRFLLIAGLIGLVALVSWWQGRLSDMRLGMLCGMSGVFVVFGALQLIRHRRRHTHSHD